MLCPEDAQIGLHTIAVFHDPGVILFSIVLNDDTVNGTLGNAPCTHE